MRRFRELSPEEQQIWTLATANVTTRVALGEKRNRARRANRQLAEGGDGAPQNAASPDISREAFARMLAASFAGGSQATRDVDPRSAAMQATPSVATEDALRVPAAQRAKRRSGSEFEGMSAANRLHRVQALDLHGLTLQAAHQAVRKFVKLHWERGNQDLLIITGKGESIRRDKSTIGPIALGGNLRRELPIWLTTPAMARWIDALGTARPDQGGEGAYWVRLRRKR